MLPPFYFNTSRIDASGSTGFTFQEKNKGKEKLPNLQLQAVQISSSSSVSFGGFPSYTRFCRLWR